MVEEFTKGKAKYIVLKKKAKSIDIKNQKQNEQTLVSGTATDYGDEMTTF